MLPHTLTRREVVGVDLAHKIVSGLLGREIELSPQLRRDRLLSRADAAVWIDAVRRSRAKSRDYDGKIQ
jgi:hypothetical protein